MRPIGSRRRGVTAQNPIGTVTLSGVIDHRSRGLLDMSLDTYAPKPIFHSNPTPESGHRRITYPESGSSLRMGQPSALYDLGKSEVVYKPCPGWQWNSYPARPTTTQWKVAEDVSQLALLLPVLASTNGMVTHATDPVFLPDGRSRLYAHNLSALDTNNIGNTTVKSELARLHEPLAMIPERIAVVGVVYREPDHRGSGALVYASGTFTMSNTPVHDLAVGEWVLAIPRVLASGNGWMRTEVAEPKDQNGRATLVITPMSRAPLGYATAAGVSHRFARPPMRIGSYVGHTIAYLDVALECFSAALHRNHLRAQTVLGRVINPAHKDCDFEIHS